MKTFFVKILSFTIFASIFYGSILLLWGNYAPDLFKPNLKYLLGTYGHTFTRLKEAEQLNGDIDILFLGSSHTFRGFDTRIFKEHGFNTFNLGTSSQTPIQTLMLTRKYLDQIQPKFVIYEVYPMTLIVDGVEGVLDIVSNDSNDLHSLQMVLKTNNVKTFNTLIYSTTRDVLCLNKSFSEPIERENEIRGNDTYIEGGFVEKEAGFLKMGVITPENIIIRKDQLKAFEQVLEEVNSRDINLILVYAPISKAMYPSLSNRQYYDSLMSTYAKYYNFNEMMNLDDTLHFYDRHHLNQVGVELFNDKLINTLHNNSDFHILTK